LFYFAFFFVYLIILELKVLSLIMLFVDVVWWQNVRAGSTLSKEHLWECVILVIWWILLV